MANGLSSDANIFPLHTIPPRMPRQCYDTRPNKPSERAVLSHLGVNGITMRFNGFTSAPLSPTIGTPQGSNPHRPVHNPSPRTILFDLFVDDGAIFASRPTFISAASKLSDGVRSAFFIPRPCG